MSGTPIPARLERLLRLLWEEWDPIGVNHNPNASDEYDGYAHEIWDRLRRGADIDEVEAYLHSAETDSMGMWASGRARVIAEKAVAIFRRDAEASSEFTVRLTPEELAFLRASEVVPDELKAELGHVSPVRMVAIVNAETAETLRERLFDQLAVSGLDEDYALTPRGRIIDELTDKLFRREPH